MSLSIAMALTFYLLGRSHRWHYQFNIFFGAQGILIVSVLGLLLAQTWWHMTICLVVGGVCVGVTYSSNLFYGVSGGRDRARLMAIHELVLSCGFVIGSTGGGYVTDHVALRAAYPICAALLAGGMVVQWILASRMRRFLRRVPSSPNRP
jgi:predicted MFS family arabinose efflux permease